MASSNSITIVGNLTREPEIKFLPSGLTAASFGIAHNRSWKNKDNEWEEETSFFNVSVYGQLAENCAESLGVGTRVMVMGSLKQRSWETDDGEKRSVVEITADEVAPSLKFATAEVTKNEKKDTADGGKKSSGSSKKSSKRNDDEEPF